MAQEVTIVLLAVANNHSSEVGRFKTPVTAAVIVWHKIDGYIHTIKRSVSQGGKKKKTAARRRPLALQFTQQSLRWVRLMHDKRPG